MLRFPASLHYPQRQRLRSSPPRASSRISGEAGAALLKRPGRRLEALRPLHAYFTLGQGVHYLRLDAYFGRL